MNKLQKRWLTIAVGGVLIVLTLIYVGLSIRIERNFTPQERVKNIPISYGNGVYYFSPEYFAEDLAYFLGENSCRSVSVAGVPSYGGGNRGYYVVCR